MKNLMEYVTACKKDLDSLGIKYGKIRNWTVNTRAKSRFGQCRKLGFGVFEISISALLLEDSASEQMLKNTIVHELLHTVPACFGHKGKWKLLAGYVNEKLPQYHIKRTADFEETGVATERKEPIYRYVLRCTKCGQEIKRQRLSKAVVNFKKYRCGKCGGRLERIV